MIIKNIGTNSIFFLCATLAFTMMTKTHGMQRAFFNNVRHQHNLRVPSLVRTATIASQTEPTIASTLNLSWLTTPIRNHPTISWGMICVTAVYFLYHYHRYLKTDKEFREKYSAEQQQKKLS